MLRYPVKSSGPQTSPTAGTRSDPARELVPAPLRDPTRYEILGEHGRGGLGRVSRAHDRELGRDVAIKELIARGDVHEVRFLREALITARLEHPGIVPVHEAGRWPDGTPFYAMKLVSGRPLRDLIAERTTVEARIGLLHHVIAVTEAIAYAHGRNIIHRDLKPANVIVGDFGETVVIDWGLAKDLTSAKASGSVSGPLRVRQQDDLTVTGSVLGTPAYMAPEQERGELVDQRADVFAIGAMLWELCALQRVPPTEARHRHRILRQSGIDRDLAAIIDKALDPDPARRYPDAGALAADLNAFKSGARIAARTYSLFATLAHWTRRHRVLAVSLTASLALVVAGAALYVRSVDRDRDRAAAAAIRASAARDAASAAHQRTEAANHQLALRNAELLLATDPSAAWDALARYRGTDQDQASLWKAKAQGLGVAKLRAQVHRAAVYRTQPLSDGSLLSISKDGTIATTTVTGTSSVLATNATAADVSGFSDARELLAYACEPAGLCILDPLHNVAQVIPAAGRDAPDAVAFSPDGRHLAARYGDHVIVWSVADQPATAALELDLPTARAMLFVSPTRLVVVARRQLQLVELATGRIGAPVELTAAAFASDGARVVVGTDRGEIVQLETQPGLRQTAPLTVCAGRITALLALHTRALFAYACQDGEVGVRTTGDGHRLVGHYRHDGAVRALASADDDQSIVAGGTGGAMAIYDLAADLVHIDRSPLGQLDSVAGPSPAFPYFASGDDDGAIRIWGRPEAAATTRIRGDAPLRDVIALDDGTLIASGEEPVLRWSRPTGSGAVPAHDAGTAGIRRSSAPARFASYGHDGTILVWDATRLRAIRRMASGPLADLQFLADGVSLVSAGEDGRLLLWSPDHEQPRVLAQAPHPIARLQLLRRDDTVIVAERGGAVSMISTRISGPRVELRPGHGESGESVTQLVSSEDGRWLAIGTSTGEVTLYPTTSWKPVPVLTARGAIRSIAMSPDLTMMSILSDDGLAHLVPFPSAAATWDPEHWDTIELAARTAAFSPDGRLLAITAKGGGVFFYSVPRRTWRYIAFAATPILDGQWAADSNRYATVDASGRAIQIELARLRD